MLVENHTFIPHESTVEIHLICPADTCDIHGITLSAAQGKPMVFLSL